MSTTTTSWTALVFSAILLQTGIDAGALQDPKHEHQPVTAAQGADISAKCQTMMAAHERMMADMQAADQRLDALVAKMNAASGQEKVDAVAAVVSEMVAQRKTIRDTMMKMHEGMMSHMMEHMQAGKESMAMCPMMRTGGMKQ